MNEKDKDFETVESQTNKTNKKNISLIFAIVVALLIASVTLFVVMSSKKGSPSGKNDNDNEKEKEIIFFTRNGYKELLSVQSDGSDIKTILDSSFSQRISDPIWTRNGSNVLFGTDDHIYMIKESKKDPIKVVKNVKSFCYDFSPDEKVLVYGDVKKNFLAMKLETNETLWTKTVSSIMNIQYSPDGKSIYFLVHNFENEPSTSTLYKLNAADGTNQTEIAEFGPYARNVKISPNGKMIVYTREGEPRSKIYIFNLETKEPAKVIYEFDGSFLIHSWSKDSSSLFLSLNENSGKFLYEFELETKKLISIRNEGRQIKTD